MTTRKNVAIGTVIIIISSLLLWSSSLLHNDFFHGRININHDALLIVFWFCPAAASFLTYFQRAHWPLLISSGYIILLSGLLSSIHLIYGKIGIAVDFAGIEGVKVVGWIYLIFSAISICAGGIAGTVFRPTLEKSR